MACSSNNISAACSGGNCTGTCSVGFADCDIDKRTNGCEINTTNNASHCGACGTVCPARANAAATPCVSSVCTVGACNANFANCDGVATNGCEVQITGAGATDEMNCGSCGNVCATPQNSIPVCVGGSCGITCAVGFGSCDGSNATGCEVELNGNPNCGACGVTCTAGLMCLAVSGMPGVFSCQ